MFNNVILDIVIGLTFIFVLYSLLALAINELLATVFAFRSRMLERGLEQMLDGKNYGYYWWDKLFNIFLWIYYQVREKSAGQQNEEIKSLDAFLSKSDLNNPEIVNADGTTGFYYQRIKVNEKSQLFTAKITDHPLYKRKSERSLFFKKPAYLSADSFSDILIDVLGQNRNPGTPVLLKEITTFINTQLNDNPDLKKVLNLYAEQANGNLQRFKLLLENWFDDSMDRITGWYKKQSYKRSFFMGFLIAITFNVSTIHIIKKLSRDKEARAAMVKSASEYVKRHIIDTSLGRAISVQTQNTPANPGDTASQKAQPINISAINNSSDQSLEEMKRKLRQIDSLYKNDIAENDSLLGLGWGDFGIKERTRRYDSLLALGKDPWKPLFMTKFGKPFYKPLYVIGQTFRSPSLLVGLLITALAISLGAPFWFDLLNRFVNLRVSGTKPADPGSTVVTKTLRLTKKPDPIAKG